jgi:hypothetical protein
MKKKGAILGLLVISILLISIISSVSLVSANLFNDIWNKITGKVSENVSDEGVSNDEENVSDGGGEEEPKPCPTIIAWRIENNKCVADTGCDYDSLKYTYYGEEECASKLESPPEQPPEDRECEEGKTRNYVCEDGTEVSWCECENGKFICTISPENACPDTEPPETCASEIKVTFNKGTYQIGDDVKIIVEIFDSQGNHIPNYVFYGQMYDDRWHTPDSQKTDNEGYFIHTGTAEKPAGGATKVKFKVYTKESGPCGSVEDNIEVKFQPKECGIGDCEPDEPVCKDKVRMCGGKCTPCPEDDDGEIFYACSGCELEDKCYPFGYRKAGNYCSDENDVFIGQLGDNENCENNFECKTNLCIDGNCVSSGLWNKFLRWFKNIFGGGDDEEPRPGSEICPELLIEEDFGEYEYKQTEYGPGDAQVPIYSDDGEQKEIVKCCAAQYQSQDGTEGMGVVCSLNNRNEVENSVKWLLIKNTRLSLGEHKGEKVLNDQDKVVAWTSNSYIVASGADGTVDNIFDAYLERYLNDFEEIDMEDLPPVRLPNSIELCEEIEDDMEKADCYIDVAISKSDFEICENIVVSDRKDKCYINVAEHTGDTSICEMVTDSSLREKCYFWVAGEEGEVSPCEEITDSSLQAMCYVEVAEKTGDSGFCDKITDSHIADKCYRDVGIQTNNKSLCEKIIEDEARQKCLDNTS